MWTLYSGNLEIGTITELKTYPYMQRNIRVLYVPIEIGILVSLPATAQQKADL